MRKCCQPAFSPFPTMFSTNPRKNFCFLNYIYFVFCKCFWLGAVQTFVVWQKELTLSQTTNFRLFQTGRVCRRQFQVWRKWQKVLQKARKHWEKEKLLITSNFSFPHSVFKRLVLQTRKNQGLFGKGLKVLFLEQGWVYNFPYSKGLKLDCFVKSQICWSDFRTGFLGILFKVEILSPDLEVIYK